MLLVSFKFDDVSLSSIDSSYVKNILCNGTENISTTVLYLWLVKPKSLSLLI